MAKVPPSASDDAQQSTENATRQAAGAAAQGAEDASRAAQEATDRTAQSMEEAAQRVRDLNEQIIESSRRAGEAYLRTYENTLRSIADLHEEVGRTSPFDLVTAMATAQANFVRDIAAAYAAAGRELGR
jgi:hypothetical protein